MTIRVILADDHAIIREGLRVLLEMHEGIKVVGVATSGREATQLVEAHKPDVAVMDISMPELNGIEAVKQMRALHPRLQVVILSIHATKPYVFRALQAGALGYLIKETAGPDVVDAVHAVHRGERFLSPRIADLLMDDLLLKLEDETEQNPLNALSQREREILQLVAEGKTSQEIAGMLSIASKSVDTYRSRLMQKIGVTDMAGLIKFAIQHGVITLD